MKKPVTTKAPAEQVVKDIRRATRKLHSSEEKIRIVLSGLRGEDSIAELCRKEGIAQSLYYSWSKEFLEAGKKRLAGDTARQANTGEVKDLRAEALALKELVGSVRNSVYLSGPMRFSDTVRRRNALRTLWPADCGPQPIPGRRGRPSRSCGWPG